MTYTATYSPDDNKLRLTASARLPADLYERVKAAGFRWAPHQEQFIAPTWTPEREDLCIELAGEVIDDDSSLIERAEERAERFEDYSERRAADAESARHGVASIADNIPFGQPILIGHHSERHARKDAERIENGMRKAVRMWDTAKYWEERAAAAIRHAKYKERADVRARRIKGIEADLRKVERIISSVSKNLRVWTDIHDDAKTTMRKKDGSSGQFRERALHAASCGGGGLWSDLNAGRIEPEEAQRKALENAGAILANCNRWKEHYENRLAYERAMLAESGGIVADSVRPEKGGGCRCWASPRNGWSYIQKVNKVSVTVLDSWGNGGGNFTRTIPFDKLPSIMTAAQVQEARNAGLIKETADKTGFYLLQSREEFDRDNPTTPEKGEKQGAQQFDAMRETLKAGVQVIAAPQLFPTPHDLAQRVATGGE